MDAEIYDLMHKYYITASTDDRSREDYIAKGKKLINYLLAGLYEILNDEDQAQEIFIAFMGDKQSFLEILSIIAVYRPTIKSRKALKESSIELFNEVQADQIEIDIAGLKFYAYICSLAVILHINTKKIFLIFDDYVLLHLVYQSIIKNNQSKIAA